MSSVSKIAVVGDSEAGVAISELAQRAGIDVVNHSSAVVAFSTQWGVSSSECNHFLMPRMIINSGDSVKDLSDKLKGKYGYLSVLHSFTGGFRAQLEKLGI